MDFAIKKILSNIGKASLQDRAKIAEALWKNSIFKGTSLWTLARTMIAALAELNAKLPPRRFCDAALNCLFMEQ